MALSVFKFSKMEGLKNCQTFAVARTRATGLKPATDHHILLEEVLLVTFHPQTIAYFAGLSL